MDTPKPLSTEVIGTGTTRVPVRSGDAFRSGFFFAFGAAALALLLFLGWKLLDAIMAVGAPFIGAIVLSLLLEPVVRWAQTKATRGSRGMALGLVFFLVLAFLAMIVTYGGPALVIQTQRLVRFFTPVTYTVTRSTGEKDRFVTVTEGIAGTNFLVKNLIDGTNYQFIVYAVNADGMKSASPVASATPDDASADTPRKEGGGTTPIQNASLPAQSPQALTAHAVDGGVNLSWQPPLQAQSGFDVLRGNVDRWLSKHQKIGPFALPKNLDALTAQYSDQISQSLKLSAGKVTNLIVDSLSGLVTAILVPIIAIFILADLDRLRARLYLFLPDNARTFAQTTAQEIGEVFGKYLRGLVIICSLYGGSCLVYLLLISIWFPGLRGYGLLIGVLAGVLYSVPYLGAISTFLVTAIAAFSTGGGVLGMALAAGGVLALNQIFDYVVMPKVVGETSGIHPLLAMFALFLGGHLFGLMGMLLAVPIAASLQGVLFRLYPQLAAPTPLSLMMNGERRANAAKPTDAATTDEPIEQANEV